MASEVCTSLGLLDKDLSGKLVQIVEEHGSSASFLISSFMWNLSRADETSLCLLALHSSSTHHQNVAKRLGFDLKTAIERKQALVIEPFTMYVEKTGDFSSLDMRQENNLKQLFLDVKEALLSMSGKKCLVIDDLSDLISLGASARLVVLFLECCRSLQEEDKDLTVIICTHCSEENDDQNVVSNYIGHIADLKLTVAGLKTGFSNTVTGSIEVLDYLNDKAIHAEGRLFHFKLTDRQAKVFAPGAVGIQA